ncbi:phosphatase PAP2 family protein [Thermoleophilia bacterium SCSIO 60948]|nr:phosphatase PAP2 family protein [Thermoleophilia bacterium SCSIO 60948]
MSLPSRRRKIAHQSARAALGLGRPTARALGRLDQRVLHTFRTRGHSPGAERAAHALGQAGEHGMLWAGVGITGAVFDRHRRVRWIRGAAVGPCAGLFNGLVKIAIGRKRPVITDHPPLSRAPTKLSFPSSHSTSSFAAAVAMGRVQPKARPALLLLATTMAGLRPYLGMHYPSDVLAGVSLGVLIGSIVPGLDEPSVESRLEALRAETLDVREERIDDAEAEGDASLERSSAASAPPADPDLGTDEPATAETTGEVGER